MVTHTNSGPWALLVLFVLLCAIILGVMLNGTEIANPSIAREKSIILATEGAMNALQTQAVISATETPRALSGALAMTQTAMPIAITRAADVAAEAATAVPMRQTATHAALIEQHERAVFNATQMAMDRRAEADQSELQAAEVYRWLEGAIRGIIALLILVLITAVILLVHGNLQTRQLKSLEHMYAEKRRLLELQAALKNRATPVSGNGRHEMETTEETKNGNRDTFKVGRPVK